MDVEIKNAAGIVSQLARFAKQYPAVVARSMRVWGNKTLLPPLTQAAPVGATGHTQGALRVVVKGAKKGDPVLHVVAGTAQAVYTEFGTKEHPVNPRYRKALRIPMDGGYLFIGPRLHNGRMLIRRPDGTVGQSRHAWAPAVTIPAKAASPWFFPTIERLLPALETQLASDIAKAAAKALPGAKK